MKRILYIIFFASLFSTAGFGQTFKAFLAAAENAESQNNYYAAIRYYQEAYAFDESKTNLLYKTAEMARMYNAFSLAEELYDNVLSADGENAYPLSSFYKAEMQQKQGNYTDAIINYDLYLSENEDDDEYYTLKAKKEKSASEYALEELKNPDVSATVTHQSNINTGFSEIGAIEKDGSLYFSSLKFLDPNPEDIRNVDYLAKILKTDGTNAGNPVEGLNEDGQFSSHTAFSNKSNRIYYTVCEYKVDKNIKCDLYYRSVESDGSFGDAMKLPSYINDDNYTTTQPAIGFDKETNKEILYFVSDRTGGKGKFDIWYSIIDDNMNMTQPMNLDSLNTSENEVTPFFHVPSNVLYFSSDGYQGLGGYDVYKAEKLNGHYDTPPIHMPSPINSGSDDLYYTLSNDKLTGYFSSNNNPESKFIDDQNSACCFDIYKVEYEPVNLSLNALTCEEINGAQNKLLGATVCLVNAKNGEIIDSITNYNDDSHEFELERDKEYLIVAKKDHYHSDTVSISTMKIYQSNVFTKNICLVAKTLELELHTFDKITRDELKGATIVLEDLTDGTFTFLPITNKDGNEFIFKIREGHKFQISTTRFNYTPKIEMCVPLMDHIATNGVVSHDIYLSFGSEYLPLDLYFNNDRPNPKTTLRTTDFSYSETYDDYYQKKQRFIEKSSDPELMPQFFEDSIKGGYDTLQLFLEGMKEALEEGMKLEITIQGFTSPLSSKSYNLFLGQRRVESVKNELKDYLEDSLDNFVESGQLTITEVSYGETLVREGVSDSPKNTKLSIYSFEASRERKVRIVDVNQIN